MEENAMEDFQDVAYLRCQYKKYHTEPYLLSSSDSILQHHFPFFTMTFPLTQPMFQAYTTSHHLRDAHDL